VVAVFALILGVLLPWLACGGGLEVGCPGRRRLESWIFEEQYRILRATLPIKLGIPDNPEVLVLRITPDR
jgi:hypothetical protein